MTKRLQVFKCEKCGNIVEMLHAGDGDLECCGEPMKIYEEKTADSKTEKHVPLIEKTADGYKVTVGSTLHPMEEKHFIEWIELVAGDRVYKEFLKPGNPPSANFCVKADKVTAREYCNLHGLWKGV
ncbi:MAG: desulfoferrodoxin [Spirochaetales bacterium]|nr:MAG: desulfoferrodoxin [Spirochaetales bacterium]